MQAIFSIFESVTQVISELVMWLIRLGTWVINGLYWAAEAVWAWFKETFADLLSRFLDWFFDLVPGGVPEYVHDFYENTDWNMWKEKLNDIGWILPLQEVMTLFLTVFACVAAIRFVRWVLGLTPTIEG